MPGRPTNWGIEQVVPLLAPINTSTVQQDIYAFETGGPAIINNGIQRDGGIAEIYEDDISLGANQYGFVSSNGIGVVVDTVIGNVYSQYQNATITPALLPDVTLYPSTTLYPSGGASTALSIGQLNTGGQGTIFFNKVQVPSYYLDCVVASAPTAGISSQTGYTLLAIRLGTNFNFILEELDPVTMKIYNSVSIVIGNAVNRVGVSIVRANTLTWTLVQTTTGFIYNVDTHVHYKVGANDYDTGKLTDVSYQSFTSYYNGGTTLFSTSYQGNSWIWYNSAGSPNVWNEIRDPGAATHGIMMGDFGAYTLSSGNTAMSLGVTTKSATVPAYWVNVSAGGAVTSVTGWTNSTTDQPYTPGAVGSAAKGLYSGATAAAAFQMMDGIVTPYGCCGVYKDTGTGNFGNFHTSISQLNVVGATQPTEYPQLDVIHKMLVVRSYLNIISLIAGNVTAFGDPNDCGNIVNDFAGGTFGYDIASGNPFNGKSSNFYFYPLSWRGATTTTGVNVYRLNNGQFVSVYSTTIPKFSEIVAGVVTLNSLGAWGAIIDLNAQVMHYNYAAYTQSFFKTRASTSDVHSVCYLKIFDQYSTSIDAQQTFCDYSYIAPMATDVNGGKCLPVGWSAWNGQTTAYLGDYYSYTLGSTALLNSFAPHVGGYVFNANIPPGGDASFVGGGINMLNAVAIQTPGYFGYYLFPLGGGSNLLPWKFANIFIVHGIFYAANGEYIYQITLTQGTTGVIQGAPFKLVYAIGMRYLCSSPERAYFVSDFDNSLFAFDGGQGLNKIFELSKKMSIIDAVYVVRDNAVYLHTLYTVITIREGRKIQEAGAVTQTDPVQITENLLPSAYSGYSASYMTATSQGLFFICGTHLVTWQYEQAGSVIPLIYRTGYYSPGEFQTFTVGRITGQVLCTQNLSGSILLTLDYLLPDGTSGTVSTTQVMARRNAQGYYRFSWNPPVQSYFMAVSLGLQHVGIEQKIDIVELLMYYTPDAEVIPLNEVSA